MNVTGKVLEVLVVRGDYTKGSPAHEALQNRLGNGTAYGRLCASIDIGVNRILFALPFDDIARLQDEKLTLCKRKFDILCTPKRRFNIGGNAHEFADLFGC